MATRFLQLLAGYANGDAISKEAYILKNAAHNIGLEPHIYAPENRISTDSIDICEPLNNFKPTADDITIIHYAINSPATDAYKKSRGKKIFRYHNITPASFFNGFDDEISKSLHHARKQLNTILNISDEIWAVSEYNAKELQTSGNQSVQVLPLFFDSTAEKEHQPDHAMTATLSGGLKNILFVGRIAPNKNIEDMIEAFAWVHNNNKNTRLILVGSERSCPRYYAMLRLWAGRLGLSNIMFLDFLNHNQLAACYNAADLFISTSKHEGFCLPLIEAMNYNIPVIANDTGGMPEALGESGVLYKNLPAPILAELINKLLTDNEMCANILKKQKIRINKIREQNPEHILKDLLSTGLSDDRDK